MKIFYLTASILKEDFDILSEKATVKPNPSNQNFHEKVIKSLDGKAEMIVISLVPNYEGILQSKTVKIHDNLTYVYISGNPSRIKRAFLFKSIVKAAKSFGITNNDVVIYDSLNTHLAKASKALVSKRKNITRIAVLTDDPSTISFVPKSFPKQIIRLSKNADASFALTYDLVTLFKLTSSHSLTMPGIIEESNVSPKNEGRYVYYGGALFEKDGTIDLLNAINELDEGISLIISGHGPAEKEVIEASKSNPRIKYLGQISKEENYAYEKGAALCISPRHYNEHLDKVSVPSKLLEYLSFGKIVAATMSTPIDEYYGENVNWLPFDQNNPSWLKDFFKEHHDLKGLKENKAHDALFADLSIKVYGDKAFAIISKLSGF